jgi:hypothetical protein
MCVEHGNTDICFVTDRDRTLLLLWAVAANTIHYFPDLCNNSLGPFRPDFLGGGKRNKRFSDCFWSWSIDPIIYSYRPCGSSSSLFRFIFMNWLVRHPRRRSATGPANFVSVNRQSGMGRTERVVDRPPEWDHTRMDQKWPVTKPALP